MMNGKIFVVIMVIILLVIGACSLLLAQIIIKGIIIDLILIKDGFHQEISFKTLINIDLLHEYF